jgi:hypothetical protein
MDCILPVFLSHSNFHFTARLVIGSDYTTRFKDTTMMMPQRVVVTQKKEILYQVRLYHAPFLPLLWRVSTLSSRWLDTPAHAEPSWNLNGSKFCFQAPKYNESLVSGA